MRKSEREITEVPKLIEILIKGKYTTISLCRNDEPYLVTVSYGYDKNENALYFHAALSGLKLDYIKANPKVCGTVIEDHGYVVGRCKQYFRSLVFFGTMSIVDGLDEKKHGLNILFDHLEGEPEPMKERNVPKDESYKKISILKLKISEMTGKTNLKK
jgi:nitroimidazol reductase NimA-like FMN-containing flavoprotein (pyridoxamine 5'-phosphate oxidase superfamily)